MGCLLTSVLVGTFLAVAGGDLPPDQQALVETVVAAIQSNYEKIKTLELRVEGHHEDRSVRAAETRRIKSPTGDKEVVYRVAPESWAYESIVIKGTKIRRDILERPEGQATASMAHADGVWTDFSVDAKLARLNRKDDLPGYWPFDPRDVGSVSIRRSMIDTLRQANFVSASLGAGKIILTTQAGAVYTFDQRAAYLPTLLVDRHKDGSVHMAEEYSYQLLLSGAARVLDKTVSRFYDRGVTNDASDDGWRQRSTTTVRIVNVNHEVPDARFVISLPAGTRVGDGLKNRVYIVGKAEPPGSFGATAVTVGGILLGALVAVWWWLRIRARKREERSC
ncbi:MAG: hypothetical protein HYS13_16325 [Planctomycetia bacterium]|nr:hypothetical protein [Planctomycetia bacterium]